MNTTPYAERCRTPLLNEGTADSKRDEIRRYFQQTYSCYNHLFSLLVDDDAFYQRPEPLRHPLIFYFGHTAVFYINKLLVARMITQRINPQFESLFAVGVDEMSWDDLDVKHHDWPSVAAVRDYRQTVFDTVNQVIDTMPITVPITWHDPAWIILMGIEHENIHIETSSVLIRQLDLAYVRSDEQWSPCRDTGEAPDNRLIPVTGQTITLGRNEVPSANTSTVSTPTENPMHTLATYGWDNEFGQERIEVADFQASRYLVSNAEFKQFIDAGGYRQQRWWTKEGWQWRCYMEAQQPTFWRAHQGNYYLRVLTEEIPMPWDWPVEVNYLEAKAFCQWLTQQTGATVRLPTEAEWRLLRQQVVEHYPQWSEAPANIDLAYFASSCPVNRFCHGDFYDIIGNVWQWTETHFASFPGFHPHPAYDDFSIPTFDDQHNLIKGGSWVSMGNEVLSSSRYAFRRHFFQHAGLRYVVGNPVIQSSKSVFYEGDRALSEYLEFHFGSNYYQVANYPVAIAKLALAALPSNHPKNKALDLGCAVGRSSFELAKHFDHVIGVDFSTRFIQAALELQQQGHIKYKIIEEGELTCDRACVLTDIGIDPQTARNIRFLQGDACNLPPQLTDFDLVIAVNLIDRLYDPEKFLSSIHQRINSNGVLVISSPYVWLEQYTEKSKWLGGFLRNGKKLTTRQRLHELLDPHFTLIEAPQDIPFVIRETQRAYQHTLAEATVWRRK